MKLSYGVCTLHINDYAIRSYIRKNSAPGFCDYCNRSKKVVDLDDLKDFMMEGLENHYKDAAEFLPYESAEGGYQGVTWTSHELLSDVVDIDNVKLFDDIASRLEDYAWSNEADYFGSESDHLMYAWDDFKEIIKHKSRYLFREKKNNKHIKHLRDVNRIMDDVGNAIKTLRLIKVMPPGTILFRARQHNSKNPIKAFEALCSPPEKDAFFSNRFSPAGISMFYCAFDERTAILETLSLDNKKNRRITIGNFENTTTLKMIDLTALPKLPSIFDLKRHKYYSQIQFLRELVSDMSASVAKDGREHVDYVPTQVMTEYLRFPFSDNMKSKMDGLIYPSSKMDGQKACVIFWNHEESINKVKLVKKKTQVIKYT